MNTKLVNICILGTKSENIKDNTPKAALLLETVKILSSKWNNVDALIFPGGCFYFPKYIGHYSYSIRKEVLERATFSKLCIEGCRSLNKSSPGALLVVGIDTKPKPRRGYDLEKEDQFCIAFNQYGIVGIGRKIFPSNNEKYDFICYLDDFSCPHRIVTLANGQRAILAGCYDVFGFGEKPDKTSIRTDNIKYIKDDNFLYKYENNDFYVVRESCIKSWHELLKNNRVSAGIVAVHGFAKPGRDIYWQRHGIAVGSAALNGGIVVGAAHFTEKLPDFGKSTLAASRAPHDHIKKSNRRKAHSLKPVDAFTVCINQNEALVRLFIT